MFGNFNKTRWLASVCDTTRVVSQSQTGEENSASKTLQVKDLHTSIGILANNNQGVTSELLTKAQQRFEISKPFFHQIMFAMKKTVFSKIVSIAWLTVIMTGLLPTIANAQAFQGPSGSNYNGVDSIFSGLAGQDAVIVIIEAPTAGGSSGIKSNHHLGSRLLGQRDFNNRLPPAWGPFSPPVPPCPAEYSTPPEITTGSSIHATLVADVAAGGAFGNYIGVAPAAKIFGSHITTSTDFNQVYNTSRAAVTWIPNISWISPSPPARIINISYGNPGNDNGNNQFAQFLDKGEYTFTALVVVASGNDSLLIRKPGDLYNGITVGATDSTFQRRLGVSGFLLSPDGRCKPDILAPGQDISNGVYTSTGSSFAAPQVSGTAAMLWGYGLNDAANFTVSSKAIILNSARKRGIKGENSSHDVSKDHVDTSADSSDTEYLSGNMLQTGATGSGPTTENWTPAKWSKAPAGPFIATSPLDDEQGVGLLDVRRAFIQAGPGPLKPWDPGLVPKIGWANGTVSPTQISQTYYLSGVTATDPIFTDTVALPVGSFITATLCWNRQIEEKDPGVLSNDPCPPSTSMFQVDLGDTYSVGSFPDLDLNIYREVAGGVPELIASSASSVDNVEHLHIPVPIDGKYFIEVLYLSPSDPFGATYTLAWWAEPSATVNTSTPIEPVDIELIQNYPNPFHANTAINYKLTQSTHVVLKVFNQLGQGVCILVEGVQSPGNYSVNWDGNDKSGNPVPAGVYFYNLNTKKRTTVKKMILLR